MLEACPSTHCLRDPTRGGLATTLNDIAAAMSNVNMVIDEEKIPVRDSVRGICELLGLDPLYLANEGKLVAFVPEPAIDPVLTVMKDHPLGKDAVLIGRVTGLYRPKVILRTLIGGHRILDMLSGMQYPRIC